MPPPQTQVYREDDDLKVVAPTEGRPTDAEGALGCDEFCARRHPPKALCLVCGQAWREHSGHMCPGMSGKRGSWPMRYEDLYPDQCRDGEDTTICGMCVGMAFILCFVVFVVIVLITGLGIFGSGRSQRLDVRF
eukprot:TRINITY_DN7800_c0_g3_i1.p1 TRINITY_DN7800_c0_g3~~TRINITY_DN7800_c0_g3_i1.p1  ORF type:complete len:153 (+),score=44.47 TRINITY_DN7800_c0_g3_i1:59-460(+)